MVPKSSFVAGFVPILLIVVVILIAAIGGVLVFSSKGQSSQGSDKLFSREENGGSQSSFNTDTSALPSDLILPFKIDDISFDSAILNPFGIIRFDRDSGQGHPGIDFPLKVGSQVVAVADGEIIEISKVSEREGDEKLIVLIKNTGEKVGWVFVFEHILVDKGLSVGQKIQAGDAVGVHVQEQRTSHYGLTYVFNEKGFDRDSQCWPDLLVEADRASLNEFWETYRKSDYANNVWRSLKEDGSYSMLALLDKEKYPDGIQLCYPKDTDARVPLN